MPSNYTQNYQLNQWEATDQVCRTDFNSDNAKIDAALAGLSARVTDLVFGSYTGDGTESRTIQLGFTPKAVLLFQQDGATYFSYNIVQMFGGLVLPGKPVKYNNLEAAKIVDGGLWVSYNVPYLSGGYPGAYTNTEGRVYYYIAMF